MFLSEKILNDFTNQVKPDCKSINGILPRYFNTVVNVNLNFKSHIQNSNMSDTNGNKNRILIAFFTNLMATILSFNFKSNENK